MLTLIFSPLAFAEQLMPTSVNASQPDYALRSGGSIGGGSGGAMLDQNQWPLPSLSISIEEFNQILIDAGLNNPIIINDTTLTPAMIDFNKRRILLQSAQDKAKMLTIEAKKNQD